jgi:cation transporter-like permease
MERIELMLRLVEREPLVRWCAAGTLALVWLTAAWLSPLPLLAAMLLVGTVAIVRHRRGVEPDDEVDLF